MTKTIVRKAVNPQDAFNQRCLVAATAELNRLKAQNQELLGYALVALASGTQSPADVLNGIVKRLRDNAHGGAK